MCFVQVAIRTKGDAMISPGFNNIITYTINTCAISGECSLTTIARNNAKMLTIKVFLKAEKAHSLPTKTCQSKPPNDNKCWPIITTHAHQIRPLIAFFLLSF